MKWLVLLVASLLLGMPAFAQQQQQPDVPTLQRVIQVLQTQRNQALDAHASSETNAAALAEQNAKLKAEIEELKKKLPAPAKAD